MKKSRFTEEQIIGILKQHEAGVKTADLSLADQPGRFAALTEKQLQRGAYRYSRTGAGYSTVHQELQS